MHKDEEKNKKTVIQIIKIMFTNLITKEKVFAEPLNVAHGTLTFHRTHSFNTTALND
jgi:hypothetical protein